MSLLEYDIIRKKQINKTTNQPKLEARDNSGKYKFEGIQDSVVFTKKLKGHLPGFYYLIS